MEQPETKYVAVGDSDVAYQVLGDGPIELLYCWGLGSHIELIWDSPTHVEFFTRLASFSRLIMLDRRGTGASDGVPRTAFPTWEEWAEDVRAVLDAVGSRRTAIFASLESGPIAILLAAMHPERVSALVLVNTSARYLVAEDYPIGISPDAVDALVEMLRATWGTLDSSRFIYPSRSDDVEFLAITAKHARTAATPRTAEALYNYTLRNMDVRHVLPLVQAPTLVLNVSGNRTLPVEHGRYLADHIDGATFVELPGADVGMVGNWTLVADEVAEFLTGERPAVEIERILTTVLFTDIVASTERAAALGDQRWRSLLDSHDRVVREQLRLFRGREVNTTGDGFIASFDGPARAIRCARAIIDANEALGIEIRAGLHTGECEVRGDDLGGLSVHIAARVGAVAFGGEVLVSGTVRDLVIGSGIEFDDRGKHELKGVPGAWRLFAAKG